MADTHLAVIADESKNQCQAFVKHFPASKPKGLFNEWFGYTMMSVLGIPQPHAALMPAPRWGSSDALWAFVSFMPTPTCEGTPKALYNWNNYTDIMALAERLMKCPAFPAMIAADQLCMNADRNMGNLVFTGKNSFVVIDHSEVLGGNSWHVDDLLKPTSWVESKPMKMCAALSGISKPLSSSIYASAEVAAEKLWERFDELHTELTANDQRDTKIALDAVWWRSLSLAAWFKNELQLAL